MEVKLDLPVHLLDSCYADTSYVYYPYCKDDSHAEPAILTRTREKVDCRDCIKMAVIR